MHHYSFCYILLEFINLLELHYFIRYYEEIPLNIHSIRYSKFFYSYIAKFPFHQKPGSTILLVVVVMHHIVKSIWVVGRKRCMRPVQFLLRGASQFTRSRSKSLCFPRPDIGARFRHTLNRPTPFENPHMADIESSCWKLRLYRWWRSARELRLSVNGLDLDRYYERWSCDESTIAFIVNSVYLLY